VLFMGAGLQSMLVFWIARNDHDMKLLALGAALGFISGSSATASALLVGKPQDSGNRMPNPNDMKPGATASITEAVAAPPVVE